MESRKHSRDSGIQNNTSTVHINLAFDNEETGGLSQEDSPESLIQEQEICRMSSLSDPKFRGKAVVTVRDAFKRYGSGQPVLDDFNMTVKKGTIYSLLGSSGCGKTTLLSCIVGLKHFNSGEVLVFGAHPGTKESGIPGNRIGYMPQDTALYNQFSISESIRYFGTLYGMPESDISASREFLMEFLDLPQGSRKIGHLSGGQKRRVSLALSLVHSPELLILDEPTVGVDPLLRESIWNHLCKLVSTNKTTVIITTHYIEEARQSDMVGLMRGGRLLAEKSPAALLKEHQTNLLEDIVLKLCKKDGFGNGGGDSTITYQEARGSVQVGLGRNSVANFKDEVLEKRRQSMIEEPLSFRKSSSLNRIRALLTKNLVMMMRNLVLVLFMTITPAAVLFLYCMSLGNEPKSLNFGFVNEERNFSTVCPSHMTSEGGCDVHDLSCQFISKLPTDVIHLKGFESQMAAEKAVRNGDIWGFMSFPGQYSDNLYFRSTSGDTLDNATLDASEISLRLDSSNNQISGAMKRTIFEGYKKFMKGLLTDCGFNPQLAELPLNFQTPIYGTGDTNFKEFILPGFLLGFILFFPMCCSGVSFITDKKQGTLERSMVAGVKSWEIMTAFFMTEGSLLLIQSALAFFIVLVIFDIEIHGSFVLAMSLSILVGLAGISLGFTIASFCNEEIEVALLSAASFFPNFALSGLIWPLEGMPRGVQYVCRFLPCTLAGEALRSIISRGSGFSHSNVWPGFLCTFTWICIFWILTSSIIKIGARLK